MPTRLSSRRCSTMFPTTPTTMFLHQYSRIPVPPVLPRQCSSTIMFHHDNVLPPRQCSSSSDSSPGSVPGIKRPDKPSTNSILHQQAQHARICTRDKTPRQTGRQILSSTNRLQSSRIYTRDKTPETISPSTNRLQYSRIYTRDKTPETISPPTNRHSTPGSTRG